jgi:hypothetical protein
VNLCALQHDGCTDEATTSAKEWVWHNRYVLVHACVSCRDYRENREPTDEQIYNGHGIEGGIRYDPTWNTPGR